MGRINENGDYQFEPGHGKGLEGTLYEASYPQGQFGPASSGSRTKYGGLLPYWTLSPQRHWNVLLVHFERRANKSLIVPSGDFKQRMRNVAEKLEGIRRAEVSKLEAWLKVGWDGRSNRRLAHLKAQGPYTQWAIRVLGDYYFKSAENEMVQSWDAGQCAYRHGKVSKIFVRQLIRSVDAIGAELYPDPARRNP